MLKIIYEFIHRGYSFQKLEEITIIHPRERDIIYEGINIGMAKAGAEYAKTQMRNLEFEKTKLKTIIEQMPAAVWINEGPEGSITQGNKLSRIVMNEAKHLLKPNGEIYRPEELPLVRSIRQGETIRDEIIKVSREDGVLRFLRLDSAPILDDEQNIIAAVAIGTDITAHELAEKELSILFDLAGTGKAVVDPETGEILRANETFCEMLGYTKEELQKISIPEISHPQDWKDQLEVIRESVSNGHPSWTLQKRYKRKNGEYFWAEIFISPLPPTTDHRHRNICTIIDITTRKEIEHNLIKSAERLQRITDIQPALIGQIDRNMRYIFVNRAYEEWFNRPRNEIIGMTVSDLVGVDAFNDIRPYFDEAFKGKKVFYDKSLRYSQGHTRFVHSTYSPEIDEEGSVQSIYISVSDNTEQHNILEAYQKSEAEFRNLANAIPQLAWMARPDGSIFWFNDRYYQYTGTTPKEALEWGWLSVHDEQYLSSGKEKYLTRLKEGKVWEDTFPLRSFDGDWRWFLSRAIPIKDSRGRITRWLGTNTDVTEQKLISDSLFKEQIMRDKFISALSHDLRTPLTTATISAQLLIRKSRDNDIKILAEKINTGLKRVDKMIEDLLDVNRIRAGKKIIPQFSDFDLVEMIQKTISDLETIYGQRFILDLPESMIVYLSPHGIRRILENLCSNAIKYGSTISPVTISLKRIDGHFEMGVHNFGNPLNEKDHSKLFEQFSRSSSAEMSGKKGWGIGLSIVKGEVEAHQGDVHVESGQEGTLFKIILPIRAELNREDPEMRIQ